MTKKDRWGSPYDPRNGGKIQRESEQERREREQHQLRGCGDPGCVMCNPETATRGGASMSSGSRPRSGSSVEFVIGDSFFSDGIFRDAFRDRVISSIGYAEPAEPAKPRVPAAFTAARAEVEDWIVTAPEQSFDDIVGNDDALALLRDAIEARAKRHAFARDKASGVVRGVTSAEVVAAVNDLFNENKGLDHAFALDTFKRDFLAEIQNASTHMPTKGNA